jgi:hypothetical protein
MRLKNSPCWFVSVVLLSTISALGLDDTSKRERPQLPRYFTALDPISAGVYDLKAEPVARILEAVRVMNLRGWETIRIYFPALGTFSEDAEPRVSPHDMDDRRFFARFANEDPGRSPMPLVSMILSLSPAEVSGQLASLQEELLRATKLENYDNWKQDELRAEIEKLTQQQTTVRGVKYRAPKRQLTFQQSVQLYAMSISLLRKDTRWVVWAQKVKAQGHTIPSMPEMDDLANRLMHQLPVTVKDGETAALLLYRPSDVDQPVTKGEFEERADIVTIKREGTTFVVEQFPVYFTADQKEWNPSWITPKDDLRDSTLMARKYEYGWTRFDGPYLWFRNDQLNGTVIYKAAVRFQSAGLVIEGDRFVSRRGGVMRVRRDPQYDPARMVSLAPGADLPANLLSVELVDLELAKPIPRLDHTNLEYFFYQTEGRQLLLYQTSPTSFSSSLYPASEIH